MGAGGSPLTPHRFRTPPHCAEIEAELRKLDREEAKLISDMKQAAKNSPATAKVLARQLVRLRQNRQRMQGSAAQITGMNAGLKTQQVRAGWAALTLIPPLQPSWLHCISALAVLLVKA